MIRYAPITMPAPASETINEVDFCGKMATAMTAIFATFRDSCPFIEARLEGMGSSKSKRARKDLRVYGKNHEIKLTGEVKLPGGVGAFDSDEVKNAHDKAEEANVQYFFTWDVNTFALWDRSQWQKPLLERRVNVWHLRLDLASPQEVARPETLEHIEKRFLPNLIRDLAEIVSGHRRDWALPPDEVFLRSLESHLDWPVSLLRRYMHAKAIPKSPFDVHLQAWMVSQDRSFSRSDPALWREAVDNAARTLAYIWTNRFIFYKALRARFPELPKLELASTIKTADKARERLATLFRKAAAVSGDYESLLFPDEHDWANDLAFSPEGAVDAWRGFLKNIESVDFAQVPSDIVGLIFQKLISPNERHRFGQHFTGPDAVDLINAFCIRAADASVLDPACGSGSFLVRAYYRKKAMNRERDHTAILGDLFGCDVALYPAHLATLNLAAREINDEANYPRIARDNFFHIDPAKVFCEIPEHVTGKKVPVKITSLDAVVGNPPYVRQEKIDKKAKPHIQALMDAAFKGTEFSGRADLHCYFWPQAARLLKEGGWFGFLTSAQWLDVDYGFDLQRWILKHFKIVAIMESSVERWFPDARVKTCITILKRCADENQRMNNPVRFVRFERPLGEIIGVAHTSEVGTEAEEQERLRQAAVDRLRDRIERRTTSEHNDDWRLLVKRQGDLWADGVRAGSVLARVPVDADADDEGEGDGEAETSDGQLIKHISSDGDDYAAGKWGRYLRAPDLYFEIMEKYRSRFVPLGEIVDIRFGVKTGCDAFFMPKDVTEWALATFEDPKEFRKDVGVPRADVASGALRVIEDGAGTRHLIEPEFIAPEVHSLMKVDRPVVKANDLDRVVLLVKAPLSAIKRTHAYRYVKYGEQATYASKKSKAVPVPQRSTCAQREDWYDLTKLVDPGFAFWPMAQQYRHIIPGNPEALICNHNLFDLASDSLNKREQSALVAVLNCTLVGLFKTFYGRYAGTEGNLKTEVIDVNLIDVPDPRGIADALATRLSESIKSMCKRDVGHMVEESLKEAHSYERAMNIAAGPITLPDELTQPDRRELDDAVFELLGVSDAAERSRLIDRLNEAVTLHFRDIRVTEIQKMEDRRKGDKAKFSTTDLAADAWDAIDLSDLTPLAEWIKGNARGECEEIEIPSERPVYLETGGMFDNQTVYFGKTRRQHIVCASRGQAELVARTAELGVTGGVMMPRSNEHTMKLLDALNHRHANASKRLRELAESRSGDAEKQDEVFALLERWFVVGRPAKSRSGDEAGDGTS
jgi:methylase of polypeptide subunit release factors